MKRHRLSAATFVDVAMEATVAGHGCRLVLRVSAYEWPDEVSGSDANWLRGEVELRAGRTGVFQARHGAALRTEELAQFRDQLQEVVASLNGTATLHHLESQVGCTVELANGRGSLSAFVKEHVGSELHVHECETDQSYLAQTVRELDAIVEMFPVRARRPGDVTPSGSAATGVLDCCQYCCQGHSQLPTRVTRLEHRPSRRPPLDGPG